MDRIWITIGAAYGFLAVALGAFGAHALKQRLSVEMLAVWRTGVEYHFYHALALILLGLIVRQMPSPILNAGGACFAVGVLLFSGSLYALALSDIRILGAITPLGGLLFLAGWVLLGYAVSKG